MSQKFCRENNNVDFDYYYIQCTLQIWAIKSCHYNPSLNERFCHKNKIVIKWKLSDKYLEAALGTSMDLVKSIKNINLLVKTAIFGALQLIALLHNVSQCSHSNLVKKN